MKATISFYLTLFLRRAHWFILIFGIAAAASVTVARILPPVYQASTRLLVEPATDIVQVRFLLIVDLLQIFGR